MTRQPCTRLMLTALLSLAIAPISAQKIEQSGNVSKSATIVAIDHTGRAITLKDAQGNTEDIHAGPEIKRFDELKVGDTVTFSYHAAVVYQIVKPGATAAPAAQNGVSAVRGQGAKPSGAVTQQRQATVTVEQIDPAVPSITVKTADGHSMSAKVEDKKNIEGLKVGDKVTVTFTEALMITVDAAKK